MNRREALEADVERVETAMDQVDPDKLANLIREHRILLAELDQLPDPKAEVSGADEIAARRAARRSTTKGSSRSSRSG